jgi:hypothetical protein
LILYSNVDQLYRTSKGDLELSLRVAS